MPKNGGLKICWFLEKSQTRLRNQIKYPQQNKEDYSSYLNNQTQVAKKVYFNTAQKQKKKHQNFIPKVNKNIQQASKYLFNNANASTFVTIWGLKIAEH